MHLLVLDDDERLTEFIATVARRCGWSVDAANWASTFHAFLGARSPDAIMLDLQLGVSDGIEQLHYLHDHGFSGPVVLMSGFDARVLGSARQIGNSLGMTIAAIIEKPARTVRVSEVLEELQKLITKGPVVSSNARSSTPGVPRGPSISAAVIADAIDAGHMELFLQPIVSAADGVVTRAEGLIRWRHPTGIIPPDQFIPVAERNEQLIDRLTQWVLEAAIKHYQDLSGQGLDIPVWVNLSSLNLHSPAFPDRLVALLAHAGVPPRAIGLEVTESTAMSDVTVVTGILTRLRLKGFSLAIDDFGTGYSSLEALRQMPFSTIKIDKGFITGLPGARDSLKIVKSVIELAHDLGLSTVAEGVESQNVAGLLTDFGCTSLQGYFFSRPLPIGEFITWCNSRVSQGQPVAAASPV